jgi:hypothetical protein
LIAFTKEKCTIAVEEQQVIGMFHKNLLGGARLSKSRVAMGEHS